MWQSKPETLQKAIKASQNQGRFFCKFLSANDVGANGSHQSGIYLNIHSWGMFFDAEIPATGKAEREVKIHMENHYSFVSRVVYYTSKKEFRITRFWSNTDIEEQELVGALIVFIPEGEGEYRTYIFNTEEEIEDFRNTFSISLLHNSVYYKSENIGGGPLSFEEIIHEKISDYEAFPETSVLAELSRNTWFDYYEPGKINPDQNIINWIDTEYKVFREIEKKVYREKLTKPFEDMQPLIDFANSALNRRKSRAGRSFEHHVNYIFNRFNLPFDNPGITEGNKKPDFLFPSSKAYKDPMYEDEKLIILGAKTTCKDRWRQVLSEGDRVKGKHLITLQQGISKNQLDEMNRANLELVVPKPYHKRYPREYQSQLWSLDQFIRFTQEMYGTE
ncbi:type II restriction endonuclease [Salimicrobium humidisoli]|uniref:type II restriction endonuclease n=1 Tax=Salimicrobium humidisoli TaxID=2029857 RepID=UPI0013042F70|nr:type II restriction endonuclease [Salimicrobium humidisoli]